MTAIETLDAVELRAALEEMQELVLDLSTDLVKAFEAGNVVGMGVLVCRLKPAVDQCRRLRRALRLAAVL